MHKIVLVFLIISGAVAAQGEVPAGQNCLPSIDAAKMQDGRMDYGITLPENSITSDMCIKISDAIDELAPDLSPSEPSYNRTRFGVTSSLSNRADFPEIYTAPNQKNGISFYPLNSRKMFYKPENIFDNRVFVFDLYNNGKLVSARPADGGHGKAGDGTTLRIYKENFLDIPEPIDGNRLNFEELGISNLSFYNHMAYTAIGNSSCMAYYIFPFRHKNTNYLLLQTNGTYCKRFIVVSFFDEDLKVNCYFD